MKSSVRAALLSGLVFPGLGQVALKHYKSGLALMLTVSASLVVMVATALEKAFAIMEKIEAGGGRVDMRAIWDAAAGASGGSESVAFNIALTLAVTAWAVSVADAYRIGRSKDRGA